MIVAIGLLSGLIRWQFATGFLLGSIVSALTFKHTEYALNNALDEENSYGARSSFILNYAIWAVVLIICAAKPNYANVIACAIGLSAYKLAIIIESLLFRDK